ncbi:hypothetical protein ACFQVC_06360 [Streptomyces monticola]|uniref:Uncharacterized protein n=1 Tax=Streptomyces monticola TaxID=2666263 RepID=A0ABW2JDF7_9ACTN
MGVGRVDRAPQRAALIEAADRLLSGHAPGAPGGPTIRDLVRESGLRSDVAYEHHRDVVEDYRQRVVRQREAADAEQARREAAEEAERARRHAVEEAERARRREESAAARARHQEADRLRRRQAEETELREAAQRGEYLHRGLGRRRGR